MAPAPRFDDSDGLISHLANGSSSFHAKLLDNIFDGVYLVDVRRKITFWNHGAERLTGFTAAEVVGRQCPDNILAHVDATGRALCIEGCPLSSSMVDGRAREAKVSLRHKLGHRVPVSVRVFPITDQLGEIVGAVEIFRDITAKKQIERRVTELEVMAFHDSLTCLPNRRYIELKVKQALEEFQEFGRTPGLLVIDIDQFKLVNDRHGHETGDAVLKTTSDTLANSLRANDLIGRWGGDEFLVVLLDVDVATLREIAERCRALVSASGTLSGETRIYVTASVGATLAKQGDSNECTFDRADQLMYVSKSRGGNRITLG